jgi:acylphosphatase
MTTMQRITIICHGRVQGVFYRDSTRKKAQELGVTGTVKNLPDGTVQIVAEGSRETLETLAEWAKQGPPASNVSHLDISWTEKGSSRFNSFEIIY